MMKRHQFFLTLALLFTVLLQAAYGAVLPSNSNNTDCHHHDDPESPTLQPRFGKNTKQDLKDLKGKKITAKNFRKVPKPLGRVGDDGSVFIGLFMTGAPDPNAYHWSLIVQHEGGAAAATRYHARNPKAADGITDDVIRWVYQSQPWSLTRKALGTIAYLEIGKVGDRAHLDNLMRGVDVPQGTCPIGKFNCVTWEENAVKALLADPTALSVQPDMTWEQLFARGLEVGKKGKAVSRKQAPHINVWSVLPDESKRKHRVIKVDPNRS